MAQVAEGGAVWEGLHYNLSQGRVLAPIEQHNHLYYGAQWS